MYFILFALVYGTMIIVPLTIVDSYYYGKLAIAPLNAVLYNVFNTNGGPELYGIESKAYYLINLFLNFNLLLIACLFSVPMLVSNMGKLSRYAPPFSKLTIRISLSIIRS